ncbi:chemotaxis protein CheA [Alteromonas hispanica]|uniref:Chemotaxis protein CheA n=1 Tax=Alteromonas hispanica TaxID=315421 RepID=A0A6L9MU06_9ALTE|nr:chemotaxis protein CheA [Alteromonas hispanica]NDW21742.1 chemotaxis protein CheA [Alteromonas hispanica]
MSIDVEQFHQVFFDESEEHLQTMEALLLEIDPFAPDPESLNSIFRAAHSIKGGSGIFGFSGLGGLTHVMENLLDKARHGEQELTKEIINQLLKTTDLLKSILQDYRTGTSLNHSEIDEGICALEKTINGESCEKKRMDVAEDDNDGFGFFELDDGDDTNQENDSTGFGLFDDSDCSDAPYLDDSDEAKESQEAFGFFDDEESTAGQGAFANVDCQKEPLIESSANSPRKIGEAGKNPLPPSSSSKKVTSIESKSIRVDTSKVDLLVNLIGELVITQSMLTVQGTSEAPDAKEKLQLGLVELERNTRELQEAVMSMRMLPISFVFNRFPRLVRDLAEKLEKDVELQIEGGATEIDKGLIEKLVDPLTHLVRNSIDHGIERPQVRLERGKAKSGVITLSAAQRGGNIVISIRDDGAGLDKERILEKARQNALSFNPNGTDEDVWNLIFAPGFSTADSVTDISGRGVGMDVVKRNIESIGGRINISSVQGEGSSFSISVPLTLAIVDGMCVASGDQVFVVPLVTIVESIQPLPQQLRSMGNEKLLWVRDRYWPILNLAKRMDIDHAVEQPTDAIIILIESSKKRFGLMIDKLLGQQQVVIKSLEQHYRRVPGAAGATIMGDGHVAIILDVESLSEDINTEAAERQTNERNVDQKRAI